MIQATIDGILAALKVFDSPMYTEAVPQTAVEPFFFVDLLDPSNTAVVGRRYQRENTYVIRYQPPAWTAKTQCYEMLDKLYRTLEYIHVDGHPVRGTEKRGEIIDGVLLFFVNYNGFVLAEYQPEPIFDNLEVPQFEGKG